MTIPIYKVASFKQILVPSVYDQGHSTERSRHVNKSNVETVKKSNKRFSLFGLEKFGKEYLVKHTAWLQLCRSFCNYFG